MQPQIEYICCPNPLHQLQPMSRVCIDPKCPQRSLICSICQQQNHSKHNTQTLLQFLNKCNSKSHKNYLQNEMSSLKGSLNEIGKGYTKMVSSVFDTFNKCMKKFEQCAEKACYRLKNLVNERAIQCQEKNYHTLQYNSKTNPIQIINNFRQYLKNYHSLSQTHKQSLQFVKTQLNRAITLRMESQKILDDLSETTRQSFKHIIKLINDVNPDQHSPYIHNKQLEPEGWSHSMRHKDITISKLIVQRTRATPEVTYTGVLLESHFRNRAGFIQQHRFKIISCQIGIWLGVCLPKKANAANYNLKEIDYRNLTNNSHYLMHSSGLVSSELEEYQNNKQKIFSFGSGDIIQLAFDPSNCSLQFQNMKQGLFTQIKLASAPFGEFYHSCIYLQSIGDKVQLIM